MRATYMAAASAAFLLAAAPGPAQDAQPAAVVNMTFGLKFDPAEVHIRAGDTVEWRNRAFFKHSVTFDPSNAEDPAHVVLPARVEPCDSGDIGGGESWRRTFTVPGRYEYVCGPHAGHDMRGVIVVAPR